jgi:uncharacterized membrane protein
MTRRQTIGTDRPANPLVRRLTWGAFWLGFALGGFFDGIVLHQVLQWHHLLSGVAPTGTAADLRFQVLADGLFHVLTYLFAALGLWLIWSGRAALDGNGADRRVIAWALIGFGSWHVVDAVLSHWILQIHRIRMDVDNPLLWDLLWLIPFGIVVLATGVWMLRRPPRDGGGRTRRHSRGRAAAASVAAAALVAGPIAALPPAGLPDQDMTLAVFRPGLSFADVVAAADAVEGRLVWTDRSQGVWLIAVGPDARPASLYRHGALLVSNGPVAIGCLSWARI